MIHSSFRSRGTWRIRPFLLLVFLLALIAPLEEVAAGERIILFGQVTDESGAAIKGATVVARAERSVHQRAVDELAGEAHQVVAEDVTNDHGTYFLRVDRGAYEVEATADGKASRHIHLMPVAETFQLPPVALPRAGTFQVRVRAADGQPAVGAYVAGLSDDGTRGQSQWHGRTARVHTDETGAATLSVDRGGPEGSKLNLRVVADDGSFFYQDGLEGDSADVMLDSGTEWTVRVEDPRGNALSGVVAHLTQSRIPAARTGDDGTFRVRLPQEPPVTLRLTHDGGHSLRTAVADDPDDETKRHVVTLEDPQIVSGRVLDSLSGRGVVGAVVWPYGRPYDFVQTDRSGGFQMPPRVGSSRFQAAAQGYGEGNVDLRRLTEPAEPVIRLAPATGLTGRVVDPYGQGIAGVDLVAVVLPGPGQPWRNRRNQAAPGRTAEDGSFTLGRLFPESDYELQATRTGFARVRQRVQTLRPPEVAEVELTMEPGIQAMGLVVDEADQPLAGATVELHPSPPDPSRTGRYYFQQTPDVPSGTSSENGEFLVADVARGTYRIEVNRPGFARAVVPGVELTDDQVFEVATESENSTGSGEIRREADLGVIVLVPGVALEGVVVDAENRPIAGAKLLATPRTDVVVFRPRSQSERNQKTTDSEGRFRFVDLTPEERMDLDVSHDDHAGIRLAGVQPPTEEPLRIELKRTAVVRGRVVDESFAPVADVTVQTNFESTGAYHYSSSPAHDQTDARGVFELQQVSPGSLVLVVGEDLWKTDEPPRLDVEPGEVIEGVEIQVSRSILLSGTVRGPGGEPAAHAEITLAWTVGATGSSRSSRPADSEGRFRFGGVDEGKATLTARHPALGQAQKTVQIVAPGAEVDLVLGAGGEVVGRVLGPDGAPVEGASLTLQTDPEAIPGMPYVHNSTSELADSSGSFRFIGVVDGRYRLTADHPDYSQRQTEPFDVEGSVVEKQLELGRGALVTGRLMGLEFEQLGATQVWAYSGTGMRRQAVVRHDATYRMQGLAEGTWSFQAKTGDQTRSETLVLESGQTEASLDFDFSGGFDLSGRVRRDGEIVTAAQVMINSLDSPGQYSNAQVDFEGRFRLGGLEEGHYIFQIYSHDGFQYRRQIEVPYPGELEIDVRTSNVEGVVRSVDGSPLVGARIVARRADTDSTDAGELFARMADVHQVMADSSGAYRFANLPEGRWTFFSSHEGFAQSETTAQLAQGSDLLGIDFALEPVQGLWLNVVAPPGMNLPPTVMVAVLAPTGQFHYNLQASMDETGAAHLSSLPAGNWHLAVSVPGAAVAYLPVRAPDDRPTVSVVPEGKIRITSAELAGVGGIQQATVTRDDGLVHVPIFAANMFPGWPLMAGQSEIQALPPGTWTVEVALPDGRILRGTATVASGETVDLELAP